MTSAELRSDCLRKDRERQEQSGGGDQSSQSESVPLAVLFFGAARLHDADGAEECPGHLEHRDSGQREPEAQPVPEQNGEDVRRKGYCRGLTELRPNTSIAKEVPNGDMALTVKTPMPSDSVSQCSTISDLEIFMLDPDGQPNALYNLVRRKNRDTHELLGVVRGMIADGHLADQEIAFLGQWLLTNQEFAERWPFNLLVQRVAAVLADERIDEEERVDLHELMREIAGHPDPEYFVNTPTSFPLSKPEPDVIFDSNQFVLTGRYALGPRKRCEAEITTRGGICCERVTLRTNYLVIGTMSSRDWVSTSWGRKIELAATYAAKRPLYLISEELWASYLLPEPGLAADKSSSPIA